MNSDWLASSRKRVQKQAALPYDWDGEGSPPPSPEVINASLSLLTVMDQRFSQMLPLPFVCPVPGGGLELEWTSDAKHAEIEFLDDGSVIYLKTDLRGGKPDVTAFECSPSDIEELLSLLSWFQSE